jgi:thioredoxin-dependent peroxiredoxin
MGVLQHIRPKADILKQAGHLLSAMRSPNLGKDVIIAGSVSDDDAKKQYPKGWKAPKPYIRIVPQPK